MTGTATGPGDTRQSHNGAVIDDSDGVKKMSAGNGTSEEDDLIVRECLDPERAERLRLATIAVCTLSVIATFIEGSATLAIAFIEDSAASFAFSFTAILDSLTSIVVIWRYCGNKQDIYAVEKERRALFFLGFFFVISFITTFAKSTYALANNVLPGQDALTWYIAIGNTCVSATLACCKFYLSAQLNSKSIFTDGSNMGATLFVDGINSAIATILAAAIIASSVVYDSHRSVWYLDAIVGVICALFLLVYGVRLLYCGRTAFLRLMVSCRSGGDDGEYVKMDDK